MREIVFSLLCNLVEPVIFKHINLQKSFPNTGCIYGHANHSYSNYKGKGFLENIVMMIKSPEKFVQKYGRYICGKVFTFVQREGVLGPHITQAAHNYCFWDSVHRICTQLTNLEVLKLGQTIVPFIFPHFSSLVHNHTSARLRHISVTLATSCKDWVSPQELARLSYSKCLHLVDAPFVYQYQDPYLALIDYFGEMYVVEIEAMKKGYKDMKELRREEFEYDVGYLKSTYGSYRMGYRKCFREDYKCGNEPKNLPRLSYLGGQDIRDAKMSTGNY